jgi:hypothetical protein
METRLDTLRWEYGIIEAVGYSRFSSSNFSLLAKVAFLARWVMLASMDLVAGSIGYLCGIHRWHDVESVNKL